MNQNAKSALLLRIVFCAVITGLFLNIAVSAEENLTFKRLFAWGGLSGNSSEADVKKLSEIGVTDVIMGSSNPKILMLCAKHKINVYNVVTMKLPQKETGQRKPLQKLTVGQEKELAAMRKYLKTKKRGRVGDYQWGGEPLQKRINNDVLYSCLFCPNHPAVLEGTKARISKLLETKGLRGIAFDFIGYTNYRDCKCAFCEKLYQQFCRKNKLKATQKTRDRFFLKSLVDFNNQLVDHVHAVNPKALAINHIYPVFLPEPLYGNRLKMDFCGQTVSWYFLWSLEKIAKYTRITVQQQNKRWPGVAAVAFIGFGDPPVFDYKSPARLEAELRAILKNGAKNIMLCSFYSLLKRPDLIAVFKKYKAAGK